MKKVIIKENQRGLLFRNGKYKKLLGPGKYCECFGRSIEAVSLEQSIRSEHCPLEVLLADEDLKKLVEVVEVADDRLALHFVDGRFHAALRCGKYAFWKIHHTHTFRLVDVSTPEIPADVSPYVLSKMVGLVVSAEVPDGQEGKLYFDHKFVRDLKPGTHRFWKINVKVDVVVDP